MIMNELKSLTFFILIYFLILTGDNCHMQIFQINELNVHVILDKYFQYTLCI